VIHCKHHKTDDVCILALNLGTLFASLCEGWVEVIANLWHMASEADLVVVLPIVLELVPPVLVSIPHYKNSVSITWATGQGVPVSSIVCIVYKTDPAEVLAALKGTLDTIHLTQLAYECQSSLKIVLYNHMQIFVVGLVGLW
jgi:hypothetical protein